MVGSFTQIDAMLSVIYGLVYIYDYLYIILYYIILHHIILYYIIFHHIILYYITLYYTILYCICSREAVQRRRPLDQACHEQGLPQSVGRKERVFQEVGTSYAKSKI